MGNLTPMLALAVFSAALGMFQFGYNTTVINLPQEKIERFISEMNEDSDVKLMFAIVVNICSAGGMLGGLLAGWPADKFGRKQSLIYAQVFSILGALLMGLCTVAGNLYMLIFGRLSIGFACGLYMGLVPLYISEIAPVEIRGGLGTLNQLAAALGIIVGQTLGLEEVLGSDGNWPILLAIGGTVPSLIQLVLLPLVPESPRFLVINKNDLDGGKQALMKLRQEGSVEEEIDEMTEERMTSEKSENVGMVELLTSAEYRFPLLICVLMHLSQHLSGMMAIFYYSTGFFIGAGVQENEAQYYSLGIGTIMVVMSLIIIPLMDCLGRRTLHLTGLAGIGFCSTMIIVGLNLGDEQWTGYFIIFFTLLFVVCFALGPGSIPFLITGELFLQGPRPAAIAIATLVNWIANLAVGLLFPVLSVSFNSLAFLPFTIATFILFTVLFVNLPETKGKSVDEVVREMKKQR